MTDYRLSPRDRIMVKFGPSVAEESMKIAAVAASEELWWVGHEMGKHASWRAVWEGVKHLGRRVVDPEYSRFYKQLKGEKKFLKDVHKATGGGGGYTEAVSRLERKTGRPSVVARGKYQSMGEDLPMAPYRVNPSEIPSSALREEASALARSTRGFDRSISSGRKAGMSADEIRSAHIQSPEDAVRMQARLSGGEITADEVRRRKILQMEMRSRLKDFGSPIEGIGAKAKKVLKGGESAVKDFAKEHPVLTTVGGVVAADKVLGS